MKNLQVMTQDEMALFTMEEVKRSSKRSAYTSSYNFDSSDLESYVMVRAWEYVLKYDASINPNFEAYIRKLIKQFTMNFLKSPNNVHTEVDPMSALASSDDEGSETDFESTFVSDSTLFESESTNGIMTTNFLEELSNRDREILSLKVDGYDNKEIAEMLNIHRNTVRNTLNKIKELALDFGLEEM